MDVIERCTCAVFDCDGVLLDSNPVKIAESGMVERFLAEHRRSGGVSRFAKFERFYRELCPVADPDAAIRIGLAKFADACRVGLRECPDVRGVVGVLVRLSKRGVPIHVISGGEEAEVREALLARGWGSLLTAIHGSPTTKRAHLDRLMGNGDLVAGGVYFGDAEVDMRLADEFRFDFVFVAGVSDWEQGRAVVRERGGVVVEDLSDMALGSASR